jgi:periplasmic protein TonB
VTVDEGRDYEIKSHLNQHVMEAKKNPSKDVHRMRGMFFQIGLGISVAIMITAFEWRTEVKKVRLPASNEGTEITPLIPATDIPEPEPTVPSPIKNEMPPAKFVSLERFTEVDESTAIDESREEWTVEPPTTPLGHYSTGEDTTEISEFPFCIVEKSAEPVGGYDAFYKMVKKELKYPIRAQRADAQGRVFVEFIVNRDGTPVDLKVIRGIGYDCDEEAKRVISLSKWNPGKQRGKPVRQRMIMAVIFKLN